MRYDLVFDNEVPVTRDEINRIFDEKRVFVAGYGSLLYSKGWQRRGMEAVVRPKDIKECKITGYERGPYGRANGVHFYGVVHDEKSYINAGLVEIHSMSDWINLMYTEMIAGFFPNYNYRVVDATEQVSGVKLPKKAVVHIVANETRNKELWPYVWPAPNYYEQVWTGVNKERSKKFVKEFLATGGLTALDSRRQFDQSDSLLRRGF